MSVENTGAGPSAPLGRGAGLWYVSKILVGSLLAWFGLPLVGISHPYWAIITICIASDPDLQTATQLATARFLNTVVGGTIGLAGLLLGGLRPLTLFVCLGLTTLIVTTLPRYPKNWRLAPVTVVIIMEVAVLEGSSRAMEAHIAIERIVQVFAGCVITLGLAWVMTRFIRR
jgi:uncharacterized membrane protein YccC